MAPVQQSKSPLVLPRFSPDWFFPDGDLLLKCGNSTLYLVHSRLLVSASQVFRDAILRQSVPSPQEFVSIHKHMRHVTVSTSLQTRLKSTVNVSSRRIQRRSFGRMNKMVAPPKVLIVGDTEDNINLVLRFLYSKEDIPITKEVLPRLLSLGIRYGIPAFVEACISLLEKKATTDPLFVTRVCRDWVPEKDLLAKSLPIPSSPASATPSEQLYIELTNEIKQSLIPIYRSAISVMLDKFPQYYFPVSSPFPAAGVGVKCPQYEAYLTSVPLEIQFKCFERWNRYKRDMEQYLQWLFTAGVEPLNLSHHSQTDTFIKSEMGRDDRINHDMENERKIKQMLEVQKENLKNQIRNELRLFWRNETAIGFGAAGWKGANTSHASQNMNIPSPSRLRSFIATIHFACENACEAFRREQCSGLGLLKQKESDGEAIKDEDVVMRFSNWVHDFQEDNFRRISKMVLGPKKWWEWRVAAANAVEICPFLLKIGEEEDDDEIESRREKPERGSNAARASTTLLERGGRSKRSTEADDEKELSARASGESTDMEDGVDHLCCEEEDDGDECMFESDTEIEEEEFGEDEGLVS